MRTFGTITRELVGLREWLLSEGCTHVALESTGVYCSYPLRSGERPALDRQELQTLLFLERIKWHPEWGSLNTPTRSYGLIYEPLTTKKTLLRVPFGRLASRKGFEPARLQNGPLTPKYLSHANQ
jgi:hypothetical protein